MPFYDTPSFKKLNKKWGEKLKKSGFGDIEQEDGRLKVWMRHLFIRPQARSFVVNEAKVLYYRIACQFLNDHTFETEDEKIVWKNHCDGMSRREIAKNFKMKEYKVRKILEKFVELMKATIRLED